MPVQTGYGVTGIPDFVGVSHGRAFYVETKAGGNTLTGRQIQIRGQIEAAGGAYFIIRGNAGQEELRQWVQGGEETT